MLPGDYDLAIKKGDLWTFFFRLETWTNYPTTPMTLVDEDLTGKEVTFKIKPNASSSTILLSLTKTLGHITVPTPTNGEITITATGTQTATLDFTCAYYEIQTYTVSTNPETVLAGSVELIR